MEIRCNINGKPMTLNVEPDKPLLWSLREDLALTGTKFSCGTGACGACTVHMDGEAVRSCTVPIAAVAGRSIETIENLQSADGRLHPLQQAWLDHQVPQCGYCQAGILMAAAALLKRKPKPTDEDIAAAITNLCRCGTYPRVRDAIRAVSRQSS